MNRYLLSITSAIFVIASHKVFSSLQASRVGATWIASLVARKDGVGVIRKDEDQTTWMASCGAVASPCQDALLSRLFEKFQERIKKPFIRMKGFLIRSFKYYE